MSTTDPQAQDASQGHQFGGMGHQGMSPNQMQAMLRAAQAQQQGQQQVGGQPQQQPQQQQLGQQGGGQQGQQMPQNVGGYGGMGQNPMMQMFQQQPQQGQPQQVISQQGGQGQQQQSGGQQGSDPSQPQQQQQMNQGSQQGQMQQMQQQQGNQGGGGGGFDIGSELKRIQQLHQLGNGSGASGNALLMTGAGRPNNDPSSFMQSLLDQQSKVQPPRFDNPLSQNLGGGISGNPLLQPSFLQDARLLMAQNQLNAAQLQQARQEVPLPSPHSLFHRDGSRRMRGGVIEPFPEKLHRLLTEVEAAGRSDVISFVANGRAFAIHKPDKFFKEIVPLYFRQSRLSSFKRQLNLYGFELINSGPARGGYFHELFVKEHPELCRRMRRVAVKVGSKDTSKDNKDGGGGADKQQGGDHQQQQQGGGGVPGAVGGTDQKPNQGVAGLPGFEGSHHQLQQQH